LKIAKTLSTAAILLFATMAQAQSTPPPATPNTRAPTNQAAPAPARKGPQPKTQAEYDAYKAADSQTDPAKLEAAATDFAQKFPDSDLRPFLFQRAMGQYQATNNPDKALEMARAVLKYDPHNAVALLTAAQMLSERTHDSDLDRDDRLNEASANAYNALRYAGEIMQPPNMAPEQFAEAMAQLRGTAHEVIATVAFKKLDYFAAIKEYNAAVGEAKENTDPVVWLRLSVAQDKSGDYGAAIISVQKAIAASEPKSQIRQLAEQEKSRLDKLSAAPVQPVSK
jgi:hypothetical protein